jgi:Zn-finger nucleic acid-binding protein
MTKELYGDVEIDKCPVCKGIFLDDGELLAMLHNRTGNQADSLAFSATSEAMDAQYAQCPRCHIPMVATRTNLDLRVDHCANCSSVFLDQGELATLQLQTDG